MSFGLKSFGITPVCRIRGYVVQHNIAFGIMSHSALCRIRPYVVRLCVVRRIVARTNVVRLNVVRPTVGVSILACLSGAQMASIPDLKKDKNLVTLPL